jgi:catechol 2,3-dioxygenase-like lactoylglutathione lyase family enzyme
MALTGVLRPGHAQVRVTEIEPAIHFYRNVLGLVETGRDPAGRVYFKAWDERDHSSVVLRRADTAGIDHFAFKVRDRATLGLGRAVSSRSLHQRVDVGRTHDGAAAHEGLVVILDAVVVVR